MLIHIAAFAAGLAIGAVFSSQVKELWAYASAKVTAIFAKK
jgi:hypothetical protein